MAQEYGRSLENNINVEFRYKLDLKWILHNVKLNRPSDLLF